MPIQDTNVEPMLVETLPVKSQRKQNTPMNDFMFNNHKLNLGSQSGMGENISEGKGSFEGSLPRQYSNEQPFDNGNAPSVSQLDKI